MAYVPSTAADNTSGGATSIAGFTPPPPQGIVATSSGAGGTSAPVGGSGQGSSAVVGTPGVQPPVQNLGDYLAANAPQAAGLGQNIANNLTGQYNQVTGDINTDQAAFDQQVQANNVGSNYDPTIQSAATDPTHFVADQTAVSQFQNYLNANYAGPSAFETSSYYQPLAQEVLTAQQAAPDLTQQGAYEQLASTLEQNPTLGMTNLDAALLRTPGASSPITTAEAPFANLPGSLSTASQTEDSNIGTAAANDAGAKSDVQNTFFTGPNAVVPAWQNSLSGELTGAQGQVDNYNTGLSNFLSGANSLNQDLSTYNALHYAQPNFDFSQPQLSDPITPYLGTNPVGAASLGSVASTSDYAKDAALSQLLGGSYKPSLDPSQVGQAGTFKMPTALPQIGYLASQISAEADPARAQFLTNMSNTNVGNFPYEASAIQNTELNDERNFFKQLGTFE